MPIRILSPREAAKIAAGEVIERPASVVKELVENALDAGACSIDVEVREGGLSLIRVVDDGCGLAPDELPLAFERHATSKLTSEEELTRIATLGFRGEALPSIAAAADVEMTSRPAGSTVAGRVRLAAGAIEEIGSAGAPEGTAVTVRRLFARQPARLKFLRSAGAETAAVAGIVTQYALAYPEVRFTLVVDGREALRTDGSDLAAALGAVYGAEVAAALIAVDGRRGEIAVGGYAAGPEISRANRNYITLFINRRCVRNRSLLFAVEEAYQGLMPSGRHPLAAIDLRMPPEEVDVNVHPTKVEVRLRDEREAFAAVQRSLREALAGARVPATAPRWSLGDDLAAPPVTVNRDPWPAPPPPLPARMSPGAAPASVEAEAPRLDGSLPLLRAVGQVGNTYVIAEGPEGMYLIDQHAAHERVLYERFLSRLAEQRPEVQGLLAPVVVELTALQAATLASCGQELAGHGYDLQPFGGQSWALRAVPAAVSDRDPASGLRELLDLLGREEGDDRRHRVAASLACHAAVRAGKALSPDEMRELVRSLESTSLPRTCPHGRPTMLHLSADELAREFRRR